MKIIEDLIQSVIKNWNANCKQQGIPQEYFVDIKCKTKKYYLNKVDFFEKPVAEIMLYTRGKRNLMLWRKELDIPTKVKGASKDQINEECIRDLCYYFFYEAIGIFCVSTEALILSKDYAEYDLEKDRLKPDVSASGMVIKTTKGGVFFESGNEFDVFMVLDDGYLVYTAHDCARTTGGIAKLDKDSCIISVVGTPRIITLDEIEK